MSKGRAVLVALGFVSVMVGCSALTGCVGVATYGCPAGMDRRGDMCEGFQGFTWRVMPAQGS